MCSDCAPPAAGRRPPDGKKPCRNPGRDCGTALLTAGIGETDNGFAQRGFLMAAWAAASRAMGTRKGEQDT